MCEFSIVRRETQENAEKGRQRNFLGTNKFIRINVLFIINYKKTDGASFSSHLSALKFINGMTGKKSPLRGKFRGLITAIYNRHCVRSNLDFTLRRVGGGSEIEMTENASAFGKTV